MAPSVLALSHPSCAEHRWALPSTKQQNPRLPPCVVLLSAPAQHSSNPRPEAAATHRQGTVQGPLQEEWVAPLHPPPPILTPATTAWRPRGAGACAAAPRPCPSRRQSPPPPPRRTLSCRRAWWGPLLLLWPARVLLAGRGVLLAPLLLQPTPSWLAPQCAALRPVLGLGPQCAALRPQCAALRRVLGLGPGVLEEGRPHPPCEQGLGEGRC